MAFHSFLQHTVEELLSRYPIERLYKVQVIFPHSRTGLYFNDYLSRKIENPQWSPAQMTFSQWASNLYDPQIQVPDTHTLLLELWTVYKTFFPDEKLEKFWSWGKNLLDDLNEIDLQAVDTQRLFRYTSDWLKLETNWAELLEETAPESEFWKLFAGKNTEMQQRFLKLWDQMPMLYQAFQQRLVSQNQIYTGMLYRRLGEKMDTVAEELLKSKESGELEAIWFIGFYQLSKTEQHILTQTRKCLGDSCRIWLDSDKYYTENPFHQAGYFYRKNLKEAHLPDDTPNASRSNTLRTGVKNITLIATPSSVTQTKALTGFLEEQLNKSPNEEGQTAIVVPDESLLFSLLASLPENIKAFNVTLGFPAKFSTYQSMIDSLIQLQFTKKLKNGQPYFYFKHVFALSDHPYFPDFHVVKKELSQKNMVWISHDDLKQCFLNGEVPVIVSMIFRGINTPLEMNAYLQNILAYSAEKMNDSGNIKQIESELTYLYLSILLRLEDLIEKYQIEQEITLWWWGKMLYQMMLSARLPFSGEPLQGVQILSLDETVGIDFKHIFILSMNEKIFPPKTNDNSFIPFTIRTEYGMTTGSAKSAGHAYLYYRLLHRVENLYCFYSTQGSDRSSSEKSRYLLQLLFGWQKDNPNLKIKEVVVSTGSAKDTVTSVLVEKTPTLLTRIRAYLTHQKISPSAINTYLQCSLKFYFDYILGLHQPQKLNDEADERDLGNLLHRSLYFLYQPYQGKVLSETDINLLEKQVQEKINQAYEEYFSKSLEPEKGKAFFVSVILEEIIKKFLVTDRESLQTQPLKILALEENLEGQITLPDSFKITLAGRADRIDQRGDHFAVLDYKTGSTEVISMTELSGLFMARDDKNHPALNNTTQALIYAFLFKQMNESINAIQTGFYWAKSTDHQIRWVEITNNNPTLTDENFAGIEMGLQKVFETMLDPQIPFAQTPHEKLCKYCPHVGICRRD